jgi:hypothetical protein
VFSDFAKSPARRRDDAQGGSLFQWSVEKAVIIDAEIADTTPDEPVSAPARRHAAQRNTSASPPLTSTRPLTE